MRTLSLVARGAANFTARAIRTAGRVFIKQFEETHAGGALVLFLLFLCFPSFSHAGCKASSPCVSSPLELGTLGGTSSTSNINSEANAISGNGNIVVGSSLINDPVNITSHAFCGKTGK